LWGLALARLTWSLLQPAVGVAISLALRKQGEGAARQGATWRQQRVGARARSSNISRMPCHMRLEGIALIADRKKGTPACTATCAASYSLRQKWLACRDRNAAAGAAVRGHMCGAGVRACIVYVREGRGLMVGVCACFDFFFFSFFVPKRIGNYVINTNMLLFFCH
jgi:hypothetical protein